MQLIYFPLRLCNLKRSVWKTHTHTSFSSAGVPVLYACISRSLLSVTTDSLWSPAVRFNGCQWVLERDLARTDGLYPSSEPAGGLKWIWLPFRNCQEAIINAGNSCRLVYKGFTGLLSKRHAQFLILSMEKYTFWNIYLIVIDIVEHLHAW